MSKKSRKRNKRLLMLAALAGGAAFLGRGKKKFGTDAGFLKSGAAGGASLSSPPIGGIDHIKKAPAVVADTAVTKKDSTGSGAQTRFTKKVDGRWMGPNEIRLAKLATPGHGTAVAPPGILNPYRRPIGIGNPRRVNQKKGGSVTGIAKRGFGRALKKK